MLLRSTVLRFPILLFTILVGCRDKSGDRADSARGTLAPVYPSGPANTNWNTSAGPLMIVPAGSNDSVAVVLPEATDSTIASFQGINPPVANVTFDLFGRGGKIGSSVAVSALPPVAEKDCYSWPLARLQRSPANWQVGFASGRVQPITLDSIEAMSSVDSAALAASLARTAATLPVKTDPTFRGLPYRVRSAYAFRLDSVQVVVADIVRIVNEEANPRLEHLLIIGERPAGTSGKFDVGYFSRTAGAEESTQATELLAAVLIGKTRRPAIVVNIEYDDGGKLGLIERTDSGQWQATWKSAYTDC
jgi:hypothetical protein